MKEIQENALRAYKGIEKEIFPYKNGNIYAIGKKYYACPPSMDSNNFRWCNSIAYARKHIDRYLKSIGKI